MPGGAVGNGLGDGLSDNVSVGRGDTLRDGLGVRADAVGDAPPTEIPGETLVAAPEGRPEPAPNGADVGVCAGAGVDVCADAEVDVCAGVVVPGLCGGGVGVAEWVTSAMPEPDAIIDGPTTGFAADDEDDEHPATKASTMTTNARSCSVPIALRLRASLQ